jgi:hypothetical protein
LTQGHASHEHDFPPPNQSIGCQRNGIGIWKYHFLSRARLKIPTDLIWVSGDLLLKGAALDVVQIAEELLK